MLYHVKILLNALKTNKIGQIVKQSRWDKNSPNLPDQAWKWKWGGGGRRNNAYSNIQTHHNLDLAILVVCDIKGLLFNKYFKFPILMSILHVWRNYWWHILNEEGDFGTQKSWKLHISVIHVRNPFSVSLPQWRFNMSFDLKNTPSLKHQHI